MDGLPPNFPSRIASGLQHTLKAPIGCVGVGLHSGERVSLTLHPAPVGHGIVFRRSDLGRDIPARFDHVADARLATTLALPGEASIRVSTVEHLMAALSGLGVDNALVSVDGPELPILDGSSAPFVFLIDCAGIVEQDVPRNRIEICRPVRVADGEGFAELRPVSPRAGSRGTTLASGLDMSLSIDFAAAAIGRQAISLRLSPDSFRRDLAAARTFGLAEEIAALHAAGLARGGSLGNAVVVDQDRVLNPGGLRMEREFARHKLLDAVGDLALAGVAITGRFVAHRPGHALNNRLLCALFADQAAWRPTTGAPVQAAA
ncbi:MAG: UDP-3-O-acyl-N-acetylglucosamine deacetylase [Rhodospirillales bacterium]|jgi:UDP-3-O-[3-hydroxymyristoyl] N-acetylglucosamine deacetylase|nr:UDP-3-O-acyl-N-acetylglucosamine deacetylase [Rhodospirillales bacterium]